MNIPRKNWLVLLALTLLFGLGVPLRAQNPVPQGAANPQQSDDDIRRWQLASMDQFLDGHPEIAEQLRRDPALINNREFVEKHPALQEFLERNPNVREEFSENPQSFMRREERFDRHEDRGDLRGDRDTTRWQIERMDTFLDSHPEIAEQLRKDPSLIRNEAFVNKHPELQEFLQQHPGIREEFNENPQAFMRREERFDRQEERGDLRGDRDTTRWQIERMDTFLDSHPEIDEQLRKDPSLIRNEAFVNKHPELKEFLQQHPGIREEFNENPQAFMRREERFDRREGQFERHENRGVPMGDPDARRNEASSFGQFLGGHSIISQQLSRDPSLVNNKEYLESHAELREYLTAHPAVKDQLTTNPQAFMTSVQQSGNTTTGKAVTPKPKTKSE